MAVCTLCKLLLAGQLLSWILLTVVTAETRLEVSFTVNPVPTGSQTAFQCKVWDVGPNHGVGISMSNSNGRNTVYVRNGQLLPDTPSDIFFNILPPQTDGSTPYHLTIADVELTDGGTYSCYVLTVDGIVDSVAASSLSLEVIEAFLPPEDYPVCTLSENRLSYYSGEEIALTCSSLDGTPSISLLWIQNNNMNILGNQTMRRDGNYLTKNVTQTLSEEDNGIMFKCLIISPAFPSNGRECSIGPVAVWKSPGITSNTTDSMTWTMVDGNGEPIPRTIFGLSEVVFTMIVVAAGVIVLISVILLIVYCTRAYSCACLIRKRQSYRMDGRGHKEDGGTLRTDGTLSVGVELQYVPARPAPSPPPPPSYMESQRDSMSQSDSMSQRDSMSQQRYTPKVNAQTAKKRLSTVETALLLAVSKTFTRDSDRSPYNSSQSINKNTSSEAGGEEIIYANTSRSSSVVDLYNMGRDEDSDSGVVNLAFDGSNESPVFSSDDLPVMPLAASNSRPVSEIIYHNTNELSINTPPASRHTSDFKPMYAKVDKSRSSTMESVKKVKIEPEEVTTLDDSSSLYHNTSDLGMNISDSNDPSPPPIPTNPPSPISKTPTTKPEFRRTLNSATSLGGPEKPSFKPPPPPVSAEGSAYENTTIGEGVSDSEKPVKPAKPFKPLPPKKPTHNSE